MPNDPTLPLLDRVTSQLRSGEISPQQLGNRRTAPTHSAVWLAGCARDLAKGTDALFHGTRHLGAILGNAVLACSINVPKVAFTRSPEEAAYWATLERDDDEGRGAILVFDRHGLSAHYRLECCHDECATYDEQEERVWERHILLPAGLIGVVGEPYKSRSRKERLTAYETAKEMDYLMLR